MAKRTFLFGMQGFSPASGFPPASVKICLTLAPCDFLSFRHSAFLFFEFLRSRKQAGWREAWKTSGTALQEAKASAPTELSASHGGPLESLQQSTRTSPGPLGFSTKSNEARSAVFPRSGLWQLDLLSSDQLSFVVCVVMWFLRTRGQRSRSL